MNVSQESRPRSIAGWAWLVGLLAIVAAAWCTGNGRWSPSTWGLPTAYLEPDKGDVIHALAMMKAGGQGEFLPLAWKGASELGAPHGANWNDWPLVEELLVVWFSLLGRVFGLFAGLNLATLVAHLSAAAAFYLVARSEGCSQLWASVGGLAFGLAPFIFAQSPFHITTEYVWHVPLFIPVWRWIVTEPGIEWGSRRFWLAVSLALVTGLQSPYYTNIFCQLAVLGGGVVAWRRGSWSSLRPVAAIIGAAAAAFALMNFDTWTYLAVNGPNPGALSREYKWLEIYGLKLVDLVVPPVTHHSETFSKFAAAHRAAAPLQDEGSYLGIVGIVALGWLVATSVRDVVRRQADAIPLEAWQVLWIVLCFSTGGLNAILGAFGFTLFRTGCRYSVVILAIVLMYAARRLTAWQQSEEAAGGRSVSAFFAAGVLAVVVLWDQVPRSPTAEQTAAVARQVEADREFAGKMEAALPEAAMVFQLPVMDFPESPLPGMPSYDHFRPYLYSRRLRYSFGSMKGREREKWQQQVQQALFEGATMNPQTKRIEMNASNVRRVVDELRRLGFSAVYVNRNGFPDRGKGIEEALLEIGYDTPPIRSDAGDLVCYVLEPRP
jgi:hypothetical protein